MKGVKVFVRLLALTDNVNKLRQESFRCLNVFESEGMGDYSYNRYEGPLLTRTFSPSKITKIEMDNPNEKVNKTI